MDEKQIAQLNRTGLTSAEVERMIKEGKTNAIQSQNKQTVASIIFSNVVTYFNMIFFGLAVLVILVGSYRSLLFMPVVIANMIIGIV